MMIRTKENLSETLNNTKLSIYSSHALFQKFKFQLISISKTSKINNILWEEM